MNAWQNFLVYGLKVEFFVFNINSDALKLFWLNQIDEQWPVWVWVLFWFWFHFGVRLVKSWTGEKCGWRRRRKNLGMINGNGSTRLTERMARTERKKTSIDQWLWWWRVNGGHFNTPQPPTTVKKKQNKDNDE